MAPSQNLSNLPIELAAIVYQHLPNRWSVASLRRSCRNMNHAYQSYETGILEAQRRRIIDPMLEYFTFLTTIHLNSDEVIFPDPKSNDIVWTSEMEFTQSILRSLPYLAYTTDLTYTGSHSHKQILPYTNSTFGFNTFDSGRLKIPPMSDAVAIARRYNGDYLDRRELIDCIAQHNIFLGERNGRWIVLDTVKGTVGALGATGTESSRFWEAARQDLLSMKYVLLPFWPWTVDLQDYDNPRRVRAKKDELKSLLIDAGCPGQLQNKAYSDVRDFLAVMMR